MFYMSIIILLYYTIVYFSGWLFKRNREIEKYTQTNNTFGLEHALWYCVHFIFPISLFLSDNQPEKYGSVWADQMKNWWYLYQAYTPVGR